MAPHSRMLRGMLHLGDKLWLHLRYHLVVLCCTEEGLSAWLTKNRVCLTITGFRGDSMQINPPPAPDA
jgi:hypothetical protein